MNGIDLFPVADYWWFYLSFTVLVLVMLAVDLGLFHRKSHTVSMREATIWTGIWVSLALLFNLLLYHFSKWSFMNDARLLAIPGFDPVAAAQQVALEFLTGYVVEQSLSVDNIFVFVIVFNYFAIPAELQHRVLFFGILGALVFRGIFIALGAVLIEYEPVLIVFGAFLLFTGIKMMFTTEKEINPEKNFAIRAMRHILPVSHVMNGRFFTRIDGRLFATPLFVALIFLEMTDVVFAVDSVPAIFAITKEPLIVFTSNVFAILGLRTLYFLLAGAVELFHMLKYGLSIVLIFIGLKMVWLDHLFGGKFPIDISLLLIVGVIAGSIVLSLLFPARKSAG